MNCSRHVGSPAWFMTLKSCTHIGVLGQLILWFWDLAGGKTTGSIRMSWGGWAEKQTTYHTSPVCFPKAKARRSLCGGRANVMVKETTWKDAGSLLGLWSANPHVPPTTGTVNCQPAFPRSRPRDDELSPCSVRDPTSDKETIPFRDKD